MKKQKQYSKMTGEEALEELLKRVNKFFPKDRYKWSADPVVLMVQQAQERGEDCVKMMIGKLFDDIKQDNKTKNKK